jgi:hypothetical protein
VSRRHCSLRREGDRTVLVDHSRYGTWINGARVRERAAVRPGDRVRVGTPGVEFTLISAAPLRAKPDEEAPRLRSLHAVVPRLHLLRLRRGGAVLHHRAGAEGRTGNPAHRPAHRRSEQARGRGEGRHHPSRAARNTLEKTDEDATVAQARALRVAAELKQRREQSSTYDEESLARRAHINQLKATSSRSRKA